jgi:lipid-A-disaccharide synthase
MTSKRCYFVSAGEYSGDLLAADVVIALRQLQPEIHAAGVVGPAMRQAGVEPLLGIEQVSTMGFSDVLARIGELKVLEGLLLEKIDRIKPEFAVLVDFPGFHIRLAEQLKLRGIPVVQYIAPKLWAWGSHRVNSVRENFDLVLGILPFEEDFYQKRQINFKYVGCPHIDRMAKVAIRKEDLGFKANDKIIAMLPGSRTEELLYILPVLVEIRRSMIKDQADLQFVIPVAPNIGMKQFAEIAESLGLDVHRDLKICEGIRLCDGMSAELLSVADAAVVASGTATLEAAILGVPMVVVYRMSASTYQFASQVVQLRHFSLVNLIADKEVVPEFLQQIDAAAVAQVMNQLLGPTPARNGQIQNFDEIRENLKGNAAKNAAAEIVESFVGQ